MYNTATTSAGIPLPSSTIPPMWLVHVTLSTTPRAILGHAYSLRILLVQFDPGPNSTSTQNSFW